MSQEKAAEYLNEHPELEAELLSVNKRYTFFELLPVLPHDKGPVGTIGFNLTAERSVAVDPQYVPLGSIAFIEMNKKPDISSADKLTGFKKESRFVLCQDTGGAIKGAGRVDYFAGTGHRAKKVASNTWSEGKLYILLAKPSVN